MATRRTTAAKANRFASIIYDWLEILDANVILILILMCIVAGFNMVSGFLILIMRSTSTIVTLSALGMNSKQIRKTFLRLACGSTLKGLLIGNAAALLFCIIQVFTHFLLSRRPIPGLSHLSSACP